MKYYSTKDKSHQVTLRQAVLSGMPADNGLYMPERLPKVPNEILRKCSQLTFPELAIEVARPLLGDDVPLKILTEIINEALNFDAPLVRLTEKIYTLELFHGPTLAFKDFGARFMARLMAFFAKDSNRRLNILVATSGDTGSAVANGFYRIPGINVIVLYPAGKISQIQEQQIATLGDNITALEVKGTFDDCQRLVKQALTDKEIGKSLAVSSANSINIARLIPQIFYYFRACSQIRSSNLQELVISVPSGNFGNLTAGLMAKRMGLLVDRFIAATNVNDVVPEYLRTRVFIPRASVPTISNAMDVGNPSNFARILDLYNYDYESIAEDLWGSGYTDEQTRLEIKRIFNQTGYICDPHSAVGSLALNDYLKTFNQNATGIFLETAHPAKFKPIVEDIITTKIEIPERLARCLSLPKLSHPIANDYGQFKEFLLTERHFR
jgi:threonine synthase